MALLQKGELWSTSLVRPSYETSVLRATRYGSGNEQSLGRTSGIRSEGHAAPPRGRVLPVARSLFPAVKSVELQIPSLPGGDRGLFV